VTVRITAQSTALTAGPAMLVAGVAGTFDAIAAPARPGRPMLLQRHDGTGWQTAAAGIQDAAGRTRIPYTSSGRGPQLFRVVAAARNGASEAASAPRSVRTVANPELVSRTASDVSGTGDSVDTALSADGRWIAFASTAGDLAPGDTWAGSDVFLHDRLTGATRLVTAGANGASIEPDISEDGRLVVFGSQASNLVAADANGMGDVFVWDRDTGQTRLVSISSGGTQGENQSFDPAISGDGTTVVFASYADNLVALQAADDRTHIFRRSLAAGTTTLVDRQPGSLALGNANSRVPATNRDGSVITFSTSATNLVPDVDGSTTLAWTAVGFTNLTPGVADSGGATDLSADGRFVAWSGPATLSGADGNDDDDAYLIDRATGSRTLVSPASPSADSGDVDISADGRFVTYYTESPTLPGDVNGEDEDIVVWDRLSGVQRLITTGDSYSFQSRLSGDGSVIAFASSATNLATGDVNGSDSDLFVQVLR
jgi:Tol biopolymer transport system component